jgi:ABC-type microcin C transport system duplicated ATPase subunit YejF
MALLCVENLTTRFHTRDGIITAVDNVSFAIEPGKVLGIVGESGSGKSVACYSIMGLIPSPPGRVEQGSAEFMGQDLLTLSPGQLRRIRGQKIGMIFQDPMTSLNPFVTIGDQLMESLRVHKGMSKKDARKRAIAALEEVGIREPERRFNSYPHEFSGGMRQRVMIAMALINEPDLLIADEPTTALDVTVQAQILDLIKRLQREHNLSVIFISHDLGVVAHMADHVVVMQKGKVVETGSADQVFFSPQHPYTQKLVESLPTTAKPYSPQFQKDDKPFLRIKNLRTEFSRQHGFLFWKKWFHVRAVDDVTLTLRKGEILGLVGESGSGKSTLGRSIMRLVEPRSGEVLLDGVNLTELEPKRLRQARRDFQMIFQDPYASLNPRMTVFDALAEPLLIHRIVPPSQILSAVNQLMDDVGLDRRMVRKYPHEFSGGQRQRVAIARALAVRPQLIIADEPVSALDVTIQAQILELLLQLTQKYQLTMLFISHDLSVVRYVADRVAVMQQGKIVEEGEAEAIFSNPQHPYTRALLNAVHHLKKTDAA